MKRHTLAALASLAICAGATSAAYAETPQKMAQRYAAGLQSVVGMKEDGGLVVTSISAQGGVVIVVVDGPPSWRDEFTPAEASEALVKGVCEEAPTFFDEGVTLRVDTTETGVAKKKGPLVTGCPG